MCGPSSQQQSLLDSQSSFMTQLMQNYSTNFANQQAVLANLNQTLGPIVKAGVNQEGFSPAEKAALTTQAINDTAGNYKNAAVTQNNELANRNDSGNLPQSGVDQAIKARLKSAAAGQLSQQELGITEADYATGRSNFNNAVSGEEALAGIYNPNQTAGLANQANNNAFGEATEINQEQSQMEADIAGGITSLATTILPKIPGLKSIFGGTNSSGGSGGGSSEIQV